MGYAEPLGDLGAPRFIRRIGRVAQKVARPVARLSRPVQQIARRAAPLIRTVQRFVPYASQASEAINAARSLARRRRPGQIPIEADGDALAGYLGDLGAAKKKPAPKPVAKKPAPKPVAKKPAPRPVAKKPAPRPVAKKPAPKKTTVQQKAAAKVASDRAYEAARDAQIARSAAARAAVAPTKENRNRAAAAAGKARGAAARAANAVANAATKGAKLPPAVVKATVSTATAARVKTPKKVTEAIKRAAKSSGVPLPKPVAEQVDALSTPAKGGGIKAKGGGYLPSGLLDKLNPNRRRRRAGEPPTIGLPGSFPVTRSDPDGDGISLTGQVIETAAQDVAIGRARPMPPEADTMPVLIAGPVGVGGGGSGSPMYPGTGTEEQSPVYVPPVALPAPQPITRGPAAAPFPGDTISPTGPAAPTLPIPEGPGMTPSAPSLPSGPMPGSGAPMPEPVAAPEAIEDKPRGIPPMALAAIGVAAVALILGTQKGKGAR